MPTTNFRDWMAKAENDLRTVELLTAAGGPWDNVCFHAQQAAEKYLKAYLVSKGETPKKTHDLTALLTECARFDTSLSRLEDDCDLLAGGIVARYPLPVEPDASEASDMTAAARKIRDEIRTRLT